MIDPSEYRQFSTLYDTAFGIPPWARFIRYANNINSISVVVLAIYFSLAQSFWRALGYAVAFFVVQVIFIALTTHVSEWVGMLTMLLMSTAILISFNVVLALWLFL